MKKLTPEHEAALRALPFYRFIRNFNCGDGWFDILLRLGETKFESKMHANAVKEKFGGLQVYVAGATPATNSDYNIVRVAQESAWSVCESCGGEADETRVWPTSNHWIRTLCHACGGEPLAALKKVAEGHLPDREDR